MPRRKPARKGNSPVKQAKKRTHGDYKVGYAKPPQNGKGRFVKGDPRINRKGRPPQAIISDAMRARLKEVDENDPLGRTHAMVIADKQIELAGKGNTAAAIEVRKATEQERVILSTARDQPLVVKHEIDANTASTIFDILAGAGALSTVPGDTAPDQVHPASAD